MDDTHAPRREDGCYVCCGGYGEHFVECYTGQLEAKLAATQDALSDLVYRTSPITLLGCHCPPNDHDALCCFAPANAVAS